MAAGGTSSGDLGNWPWASLPKLAIFFEWPSGCISLSMVFIFQNFGVVSTQVIFSCTNKLDWRYFWVFSYLLRGCYLVDES